MILPNFIILGAAKAGTTAIFHYLAQHPEVGVSLVKETNYLVLKGRPLDFRGPGDDISINRFSITTRTGYFDQFLHCEGKPAVGEASPLYLYSPQAPGEIKAMMPDAKLIVILRNPVDRAYSAFLHLVRDQRETTDDFLEGLRLEPTRIADHWEHIWHYVAMGRYAEQLARYYAIFPREQIKVYTYRDFRLGPQAVLSDLYRFLEIDDTFVADDSIRHNQSLPPERRPPIAPDARAWINDALRDDTSQLETMLDRDLSHWRTPA